MLSYGLFGSISKVHRDIALEARSRVPPATQSFALGHVTVRLRPREVLQVSPFYSSCCGDGVPGFLGFSFNIASCQEQTYNQVSVYKANQ